MTFGAARSIDRRWALSGLIVAGLAVRIALLPTAGYASDVDQFVLWVGHIGRAGLGHAYDEPIALGPVMVFIWWLLGMIDPNLLNVASSADPAVRIAIKLPAVMADMTLVGLAWNALRARPRWALIAAGALLLHPALWFVSAWWGTYDSVYAAFGLAAFVLAIRSRSALAVITLVLAVMTKPQAAPLAVPFAAWFIARAAWHVPSHADRGSPGRPGPDGGAVVRQVARLGFVALATLVILWLPFIAADGPANYLRGLARYQDVYFPMLSLSAWNSWWIMQEVRGGGLLLADNVNVIGTVTFRTAGYLVTGGLLVLTAACVARQPTPRMLAAGLAASVLVAFSFLTTMHERYAFAAMPLLFLLFDDRRIRWVAIAASAAFALNLFASAGIYLGRFVPIQGPVGLAGSALIVGSAIVLIIELVRSSGRPEPASAVNDSASAAVGSAPPSTSAGSAGATSGA